MKKKHVNIPIFVPHKGCPNDCSFCNQRKITGQSEPVTAKSVKEIIERHLLTIDKNSGDVQIAFFGGSFTGIDEFKQRELLEAAYCYVKSGQVDGIRISTRPDYINKEILDMLKEYKVKTIEIGVQSMIDSVLSANDRGHSAAQAENAARLIKKYGFELGLQMMTGLFSDDREGAIYTAKKIIELEPSCVRIYPTLIIKDTKLEKLYNLGKYIPMTLDETVSLCAELLQMFDEAGITVLRVGLLGTDNINDENDVVAGPFHQSIGELAESERFYNRVCQNVEKSGKTQLKIYVNPRYISTAKGHLKKNVTRLNELENIQKIEILQREDVPYGSFVLE
ncbi:MAG: radical SAM protein [Ruminococcaceae bacterium]|nr:radical SAM protein [Oscillospiraceae bacterium]